MKKKEKKSNLKNNILEREQVVLDSVRIKKKESGQKFPKGKENETIVFTLEDVQSVLKQREIVDEVVELEEEIQKLVPIQQKKVEFLKKAKKRTLQAVRLSDIIPSLQKTPMRFKTENKAQRVGEVPEKFKKYYSLLVAIQDQLSGVLTEHQQETLNASQSGQSGYGLVDAAAQTNTLAFHLNIVANEKELLSEVNAAIDRIFDGTYGICEVNNKPIPKERLLAVPYTRFSVEGQKIHEQQQRKRKLTEGAQFIAEDENTAIVYSEDDEE